jgi:tRNA pseudouridine13 synthase
LNVPPVEREIGIEVYATKSQGFDGKLRQFPEDFRVEETLTNGSTAKIEPNNIPSITGHGRYLICVLVKRKIDIFQAVQTIANRLNIRTERFQTGGIKDTNALTAQHISISRMLPEQIPQIKTDKVRLYPLQFSNEKISSSQLLGNKFQINIRAIENPRTTASHRLNQTNQEFFKLGGCPNFFGHQRFGTNRAITHLVGKHILEGEWEQAALTLLAKPGMQEHPETKRARQQLWDSQNYEDAFRFFPKKLVYERCMLRHLAIQRGDFLGAFHQLPMKLCQLFVQACQSYLFNKFLSQRMIHELPLKTPQTGDHKADLNGEARVAIPLIGYSQGLSSGQQGEIERAILEEEKVTQNMFKIPLMQRISSSGGLRAALAPIIELNVGEVAEDEENAGKNMVSLSFMLRKGSYATVVLREFMKPKDPVEAGF